jgi:hypothetical protein
VTEEAWNRCTDPTEMLGWLRQRGLLTDRKLRLAACVWCRRVPAIMKWPWYHRAVRIAESFADGHAELDRLVRVYRRVAPEWFTTAQSAAEEIAMSSKEAVAHTLASPATFLPTESGAAFDLSGSVREAGVAAARAVGMSGQPSADFPKARADQCDVLRELFGALPFRPLAPSPLLLTWRNALVVHLAQEAYDHRRPDGTLDATRLQVLSDALEESGLAETELVAHLREQGSSHYRGCWGVDLLLGKA